MEQLQVRLLEGSQTKSSRSYLKLSSDESREEGVVQTKVYREVILITISLFMGYASLVCLQKKLYNKWEKNIGHDTLTNEQKQLFEHGTSLVYC